MGNLEKYNKVFISVFKVEVRLLNDEFNSDTVDNWDSITQLTLVNEMEDEFDVMFDSEDILDFKSYVIGKEILKKYEIDL